MKSTNFHIDAQNKRVISKTETHKKTTKTEKIEKWYNTHAIHSRQLARKYILGDLQKIGILSGTAGATAAHALGGGGGWWRLIHIVATALFGIAGHVHGVVVDEVG